MAFISKFTATEKEEKMGFLKKKRNCFLLTAEILNRGRKNNNRFWMPNFPAEFIYISHTGEASVCLCVHFCTCDDTQTLVLDVYPVPHLFFTSGLDEIF